MVQNFGEEPKMTAYVMPSERHDQIAFRDDTTGTDYEVMVTPWVSAEELVGTMCVRPKDGTPQEFRYVVIDRQPLRVGRPHVFYEVEEDRGKIIKGDEIPVGKIALASLFASRRGD